MNDQVTREETSEILRLAEQCLEVEGDLVELGCYRGDTSVLLGKLLQQHVSQCPRISSDAAAQPSKASSGSAAQPSSSQISHLWIYDSFAGLPEKAPEDSSGAGANFQAGALLVTKREVLGKLHKHGLKTSSHPDLNLPTVIVKKAWFSDLTNQDLPEKISFAFCDGDLYSSIRTSLQLVAPRLAPQGIIVVHDYNNPELPGSARAVDEFLRSHSDFRLTVRYTLAILQRR